MQEGPIDRWWAYSHVPIAHRQRRKRPGNGLSARFYTNLAPEELGSLDQLWRRRRPHHPRSRKPQLFIHWLRLIKDLGKLWTLGGELFHTTATVEGGSASFNFNLGGQYNFDDGHHILFSAGRGILGDPNQFMKSSRLSVDFRAEENEHATRGI